MLNMQNNSSSNSFVEVVSFLGYKQWKRLTDFCVELYLLAYNILAQCLYVLVLFVLRGMQSVLDMMNNDRYTDLALSVTVNTFQMFSGKEPFVTSFQ